MFSAPLLWSICNAPPSSSSDHNDVLCRQANIGLYDGPTDLRHFGEGELFLTPSKIAVSFPKASPPPNEQPASAAAAFTPQPLCVELELACVQSVQKLSGFMMFSSPKVELTLKRSNTVAITKISFRNGGIDFFVSQLEQCLKKKAWAAGVGEVVIAGVKLPPPPVSSLPPQSTSLVLGSEVPPPPSHAFLGGRGGSNNTSGGQASGRGAAGAASSHYDDKSSFGKTSSAPATASTTASTTTTTTTRGRSGTLGNSSFSTTHAGIAGVVAMQSERADKIKKTIQSSTTEVDELILKSRELSKLMMRFREDVAKGDYKLCTEQVEQLKRLDSRFAEQQQEDDDRGAGNSEYRAATAKEQQQQHQHLSHYPTATDLANELIRFLRRDPVLSQTAVCVPLVELYAAFNTKARGFGYEVSAAEFHEGVCVLVKNFRERRLSMLDDASIVAQTPSFALKSDHLVQFHVLAALVPVLERQLGPKPKSLEDDVFCGHNNKAIPSSSSHSSTSSASVTAMQFSRLLHVPVDEAQKLLLQFELDEGLLVRDVHAGVGLSFSWNPFCFVA